MAAHVQFKFKLIDDYLAMNDVDVAIRRHFFQPDSDNEWLCGWYNMVGLCLARGFRDDALRQELAEICEHHQEILPAYYLIAGYLETAFEVISFGRVGKF